MKWNEQILSLRLSIIADHESSFYSWFLQVLLVPSNTLRVYIVVKRDTKKLIKILIDTYIQQFLGNWFSSRILFHT